MSNAMLCPSCGWGGVRTIDVRGRADNSLRRRRECESCSYRFTTTERMVGEPEPSETIEALTNEELRREIAIIAGVLVHREATPINTARALRNIADRLELRPRIGRVA